MNEPLTTGEQLEEWRRLVSWVLWKIATGPTDLKPFEKHTPQDMVADMYPRIIQEHAQHLFSGDTSWVSNVVGEFAANKISAGETIDWAEFEAAIRGRQ